MITADAFNRNQSRFAVSEIKPQWFETLPRRFCTLYFICRNAEQDYRESLVKCSILELASKDLEKYYKALDRAIMKYHQIKMEEINKIIKALWQETYCGSGNRQRICF